MNDQKVCFDEKMKGKDEVEYLRAEVARLQLQLDNAILYAKLLTEEMFERGQNDLNTNREFNRVVYEGVAGTNRVFRQKE